MELNEVNSIKQSASASKIWQSEFDTKPDQTWFLCFEFCETSVILTVTQTCLDVFKTLGASQ